MTLRPPQALAAKSKLPDNPVNAALEQEVLAEKMATYVRLVKKLEEALAALRDFERAHGDSARSARGPARARPNGRASMASRPAGGSRAIRHGLTGCPDARPKDGTAVSEKEKERLLDAAGEALWYVMIQRDLCGFRRHDLFYRDLRVPAAVRLRMGPAG